jgi:hypothetical protein
MYKYLPSKKFIFTLISIIIASVVIYGSVLYKERQIKKNTVVKEEEISKQPVPLDNPIQIATTTTKIDPIKTQAGLDKLTTTEKMSREILIQYSKISKPGSLLTPDEVQSIVNSALTYLPKMTFKMYSEKDISTTNNLEYSTLRIYSNNVAKIILDNLNTPTETIDSIIADIDTGVEIKTDAEIGVILQRFTPLINKNQQTISDLLKITVPIVFTSEHLNLINSFEEISEKLVLMQKSYNDMAILVNVKGSYSTSTEKLAAALIELTRKLSVAKVTFGSTNDYGYQFFNVIMTGN